MEHLDPGERLGELLFGLIMVLTFTLGAGIELQGDRAATRELLIAALGCNAAWGIIDAALYLMGRLSERGRLHRLVKKIQAAPRKRAGARARRPRARRAAAGDRAAGGPAGARRARARSRARDEDREESILTADDAWAGLAVFWLVFLTALPAVLPFLVLRDALIAMRASNALLIGLLFYVGWRWAAYTGASRWRTALFVALLGVALVVVAIALGG